MPKRNNPLHYQYINKMTDPQFAITEALPSSRTASGRKIYSSSTHNVINKPSIDEFIEEFKTKREEESKKRENKESLKESGLKSQRNREDKIGVNIAGMGSARQSFSKCKSERTIKYNEEINNLKVEERRHELAQKHRESLEKWKVVRGIRKRQQKEEQKKLEEELRDRRRQSDMENFLKRKNEQEERKFDHETKNQWIKTLQRLRSKGSYPTVKTKRSKSIPKSKVSYLYEYDSLQKLHKADPNLKSTYNSTNYESHRFYPKIK